MIANATRQNLVNAKHTGKVMHRFVRDYYTDMAPYASQTIYEFFDTMKNLPYQPDPKNIELLKRPYYTMQRLGPGGDCDDKSIAVASYATLNSIPYRFLGVGKKVPGKKYRVFDRILLTHVYTELYIGGKWVTFDTTYQFNVLGQAMNKYDRIVIL